MGQSSRRKPSYNLRQSGLILEVPVTDTPRPRTCPQCSRIVPRQVDTCRCGYQFPATVQPPPLPAPQDDRAPSTASGSPLRVLAWSLPLTALIIVAGMAIILRRQEPAPQTIPAQPVRERPALPDQAPPAAVPKAQPSQQPAAQPPIEVPPATEPTPPAAGAATPASPAAASSLADLVSRCSPAVVTIESAVGLGTGFFVTPNRIITNHHVVMQSTVVTLRLAGGQQSRGRVVRRSIEADLAMIESEVAFAGSALTLRPVSGVRPGEEVLAIGSPALGRSALESSVTRGIISGIRSMEGITVIQTDAALNPGNSGGPLVDASGRVVGINTIKAIQQESIGFAVAADYAQALLDGQPVTAAAGSARAGVSGRPTPIPAPPAAPSESEVQREAGTRQFEAEMEAVAPHVARFIKMVENYRDGCLQQRRGQSWQTVEPAIASDSPASPDCVSLRSDIVSFKGEIKNALRAVSDVARRAGVYPGQMRSIMAKYGLSWEGWER